MALVKVNPKHGDSVYLGPDYGYRKRGEEFEYAGPKNANLEPVRRGSSEVDRVEGGKG